MANQTDTFTANASWVCPASTTQVNLLVIAGGGGGAAGGASVGGGGGGGGASIQHTTLGVTPGQTYTITIPPAVGAGTLGATCSFANATTTIARAVGGKGGSGTTAGAGGLSSNATNITPAGGTAFTGGNGAAASGTTGGGGGSSAGTLAGNNAVGSAGGLGPNAIAGDGGTGGAASVAGTAGGRGAGGGGGGSNAAGGAGGAGYLRLIYEDVYPPVINTASTTVDITTRIEPSFVLLDADDGSGATATQLVWTITGGAHAGYFNIIKDTGTWSSYNLPSTSNRSYLAMPRGMPEGTYTVELTVSDAEVGGNTDTETYTITVTTDAGYELYSNTITGSGAYTWTAPEGTYKAAVEVIGAGGKGASGAASRDGAGGAGGAWADCEAFLISAGDTIQGTIANLPTTTSANNAMTANSTISGVTTVKINMTNGAGETKRIKFFGGAGGAQLISASAYGGAGGSSGTPFANGAPGDTGSLSPTNGGEYGLTGWWGGFGADGPAPDGAGNGDGLTGDTPGGGGSGGGGGSTGNLGGNGGGAAVKIYYLVTKTAGGSTTFF